MATETEPGIRTTRTAGGTIWILEFTIGGLTQWFRCPRCYHEDKVNALRVWCDCNQTREEYRGQEPRQCYVNEQFHLDALMSGLYNDPPPEEFRLRRKRRKRSTGG